MLSQDISSTPVSNNFSKKGSILSAQQRKGTDRGSGDGRRAEKHVARGTCSYSEQYESQQSRNCM